MHRPVFAHRSLGAFTPGAVNCRGQALPCSPAQQGTHCPTRWQASQDLGSSPVSAPHFCNLSQLTVSLPSREPRLQSTEGGAEVPCGPSRSQRQEQARGSYREPSGISESGPWASAGAHHQGRDAAALSPPRSPRAQASRFEAERFGNTHLCYFSYLPFLVFLFP